MAAELEAAKTVHLEAVRAKLDEMDLEPIAWDQGTSPYPSRGTSLNSSDSTQLASHSQCNTADPLTNGLGVYAVWIRTAPGM